MYSCCHLQTYPSLRRLLLKRLLPNNGHTYCVILNCKIKPQCVTNAVDRLTCLANHEAGCERANSKFNRSKNDLSSRMKLPMILAWNRAGSNGPPIHLFDLKPILYYWKSQNRFLALKSKETDASLVIQ